MHGPDEERNVLRRLFDEGRLDSHMGRHGRPCVVAFGRGEIVHQPVHLHSAVLFQTVVELFAGLAVELYAAVVVEMADAQHLVDRGQIPPFAEVAAPFEGGIPLRRVGRRDPAARRRSS